LYVVLALGTSFAYGVANFLGPLFTRRYALGAVLLLGQLAALVCAGLGLVAAGEPVPPADAVAVAALAGIGNAVGLAAYLRATELGPVSVVSPIGNTGTVLPVLYGLARGESLHTLEGVGIVLAMTGAILVARRPTGGGSDHITRAGLAWSVLGAVAFGVFLTAMPAAAEDGRWWALVDGRIASVLVVMAFLIGWRRSIAVPAGALPLLAIPGVLLITGTALYVIAADDGPLAVVSVLASLNTVVTVGLSVLLLGERLSRAQTIGFAAATLGVALLAA
jgi:drug/metabolite transporter (DMT)-like permease